mgnify:FL=1
MITATKLMSNQDFVAMATVDAVVLLAEKSGINSASLMSQLVGGENLELTEKVKSMVNFAAETTAKEFN